MKIETHVIDYLIDKWNISDPNVIWLMPLLLEKVITHLLKTSDENDPQRNFRESINIMRTLWLYEISHFRRAEETHSPRQRILYEFSQYLFGSNANRSLRINMEHLNTEHGWSWNLILINYLVYCSDESLT